MKIELESNLLKTLFRNVYFINGTAYAGKSTMVKLLAEKYDGICCGENYHDELRYLADPEHQPHLSYFETMSGWQEFVTRTPEQYDTWITGSSFEAAQLEIIKLLRLSESGKKIFVDTNIPVEVLAEISDKGHVLIMLAEPEVSVNRFFQRPDKEKQFLYQLLMNEENPDEAMDNFRKCLMRVNSPQIYNDFLHSGFPVITRNDKRTIEETLRLVEKVFGLK